LLLILLSLAGGIALFVQAGAIAQRDTAPDVDLLLSLLNENAVNALGRVPTTEVQDERQRQQRILEQSTAIARRLSQPADTATTISIISTRIGTVLLLIFLVQILVSLYRYTMKLSAFYNARADALDLLRYYALTDLENISRFLAADFVDFGKLPASPSQNAVELAKEVLSKQAK
jgi:hypothetical protein